MNAFINAANQSLPALSLPQFCRMGRIPHAGLTDIVLLEDEALIAMDIKGDLHKWGYARVSITHTEAQARATIEKYQSKLVIIDVALQNGEDGIEIAARLKSESFKVFRSFFLTAHSDP